MSEYIWKLKDLEKVKKNGYKVFSCFSCGGGSSMGYKLAGYTVLGNCEIDEKINAMYVKNNHPKYNFRMGVQDLIYQNIPDELFDLDVLDGSPPCSTFSMAGQRESNWGKKKKFREGQAAQVLDDLFFDFLNVVEKLKPKIVIAENVKGMLGGNARGYLNLITKRFNELGYDVQLFLLNAAKMGVPQKRERVFFVCRRKDLGLPKIKLSFNEKPIVYGEYKDDDWIPINKDTMTYRRWTRRSHADKTIGDIVKRTEKGKNSGFTTPYAKDNEVPATMTASVRHVRFDVPGLMSDRDVVLTQSFPLDYDFNGNDPQYVCGMSVPPVMMKRIAKEVQKQWLDKIERGEENG